MAVAISKFETAASAFLKTFPIGSTVTADRLVAWATKHSDGLANDMLVGDADKRIGALRRHLNSGGASRNFTEDERFFLKMEDPIRKTMLVIALVDRTSEQAADAFDRSAKAAMAPIRQSQRAIEDHKLEELDPETAGELEEQLKELIDVVEPIRNLLSKQNIDRHVKRLEAKGYSPQQARDLLELMPTFSRFAKTQKVITG